MGLTKKRRKKLFKIYREHVADLTEIVISRTNVLELKEDSRDEIVRRVGLDCGKVLLKFANYIEGKVQDEDCEINTKKAESILAEGFLNISDYLEEFQPDESIMTVISLVCIDFSLKSKAKQVKWGI